MAYCGPHGIPWMDFLRWDRMSRDAAIAWAQLQRETCQRCNTRHEEWDPERGGHVAAYVATVDECRGCAAIEARQERLSKDIERGKAMRGSSVALRLQVPFRGGPRGEDPGQGVGPPEAGPAGPTGSSSS